MQASGDVFILRRGGARQALVFGLTWFALVGSHIAPMARARARQLKATHYVAGGLRAAAGGCGRIGRSARRGELYAAGQLYAHLYSEGAVASIAALPDGRHWLIAAQDGAVMSRGDRLYATREAAEQALLALRAERPGLRMHDGSEILDRLQREAQPAARLLAVDTQWGSLPWPVRAFALGLLGAALLPPAWRQFGNATPAAPQAVDPQAAWQAADRAWRQGLRIHAPEALQRVVQSLYDVPLAVRGWTLQRAHCQPAPAVWQCAAHFQRTWPDATYAALAAAAPAGWRIEFIALDRSALHWEVAEPARTLASLSAPPVPPQVFVSGLQRVAQAFADVQLGAPALLDPPAPRDAGGVPVPAPAGMPRVQARTLSVAGPLRSFGVLALHGTAAAWTSLTLRLEPGRSPALAASVLVAHLQGTVYEAY